MSYLQSGVMPSWTGEGMGEPLGVRDEVGVAELELLSELAVVVGVGVGRTVTGVVDPPAPSYSTQYVWPAMTPFVQLAPTDGLYWIN